MPCDDEKHIKHSLNCMRIAEEPHTNTNATRTARNRAGIQNRDRCTTTGLLVHRPDWIEAPVTPAMHGGGCNPSPRVSVASNSASSSSVFMTLRTARKQCAGTNRMDGRSAERASPC